MLKQNWEYSDREPAYSFDDSLNRMEKSVASMRGDVSSQNLFLIHHARRSGERLVVFLRIDFWRHSDDCMIRSTKGARLRVAKTRDVLYKRDLGKPDPA